MLLTHWADNEHINPIIDTKLTKKTEINHTNGGGYNGNTNRIDTERKLNYLSMFDKPRGLL